MESLVSEASSGSLLEADGWPPPGHGVVLRLDWRKVVAQYGVLAVAFFGTMFGVLFAVQGEKFPAWFVIPGMASMLCIQLALIGVFARRSFVVVDSSGLYWAYPLYPTGRVPWSEVNAVYRLMGWPMADIKHLPWWSPMGLYLPLRHQLADRRGTEARLRSLRDSRPANQWPKAAKEFFSIYCR